jgi:hypothetical protein
MKLIVARCRSVPLFSGNHFHMLLQTNSYIVPKDRRSEHTRLLRKFRATLMRLGADHFEVYEQVGANWASGESTGRFVQIMRFRDHQHQQEVQAREKQDPVAQQLISEFCALINFPYQQQQGLFAVGFYTSALPVSQPRSTRPAAEEPPPSAPPAQADGGASLLDMGEMSPAVADANEETVTPMRMAGDAPGVGEEEIALESDNGEHAGAFRDADEPLTDSDRDAILGELEPDAPGSAEGGHPGGEQRQ